MKTSTKTILIISHILISLFTIWSSLLERALICRPDLPESAFLYGDISIGVSCIILFVLPFLMATKQRWYQIIGFTSYSIISLNWFNLVYYIISSLILYSSLNDLPDFFEMTHIFYIICIVLYFYPIVVFIKLFIGQKKDKNNSATKS